LFSQGRKWRLLLPRNRELGKGSSGFLCRFPSTHETWVTISLFAFFTRISRKSKEIDNAIIKSACCGVCGEEGNRVTSIHLPFLIIIAE
jgi:hypothetical protein